jgi:diketogulonate reductase-like aldo/keto reductase
MQNHYNLAYREEEREMIPLCLHQGVGVLPYSPLARGLLAGSRDRGGQRGTVRSSSDPTAGQLYGDADFDVVDAVREVAAEHGVPPARVALAWLLARPAVTAPILGATRLAHLDDAIAALDLDLTTDEVARLQAPYRPHPILGHEGFESVRDAFHMGISFTWGGYRVAPPAEADACGASPVGRRRAGSASVTVGGSRAVIGAVPWFIFDL